MKFFTKDIKGVSVSFFAIKTEVGWLATINGKEYGDFVTLQGVTTKGPVDFDARDQAFQLLENQATTMVEELTKKEEGAPVEENPGE